MVIPRITGHDTFASEMQLVVAWDGNYRIVNIREMRERWRQCW